jgi:SAM-dependent methyltransferase
MFAINLSQDWITWHIVEFLCACHNASMHQSALFSEPMVVEDPHECRFYHSLDLPSFGSVRGQWDLRGRFDDYTGSLSWSGKSVLDVGTASGFLSFEAERRGARVVSFDIDDAQHINALAFANDVRQLNRKQWLAEVNTRILSTRKSYWLAHRDYRSRNKACYSNVYDIPSALGVFDIVLVGQILVHLSDVVRALERAAAHCSRTLVVAEGMIDNDRDAYSCFLADAGRPDLSSVFWHHSTGFYVRYIGILGFKLRRKSIGTYICNSNPTEPGVITTLVFDRQ